VTRQRPLAGQRRRSRLEPAGPDPSTPDAAPPDAAPPDAAPQPAGRPRRTAVLDPAPAGAGVASDTPRVRRRPDLLVLGAGVLVVALVLTAAVLTMRARAADRTERARTEAVAAAETDAVDLLSYDYRHLDRDFARAGRALTGQFAEDYAHTTETVVRPTAEEVKAVVKADVVSSSVVSAGQNRVVVLLFVNQSTTSTRVEGPKVDLSRVRMTLVRVGDGWKVSAVKAL
jgi:Mce-associated membrane protein